MRLSDSRTCIIKFLFISLALLGLPWIASAQVTTHYITPSGAGTHSGADWNNAFAGLPATLTRGDTYVLAGGTYGSYTFSTPVSGTQAITIRKAQAGTFNSVAYNDDLVAGWNTTFQTAQAVFTSTSVTQWSVRTDFWNFDGVQTGTKWATTGYGIKITPGNNNQDNQLVDIGQWPNAGFGNHVSIKNIEFVNAGQSFDFEQFDLIFNGTTSGYVGYCYFAPGAQNHIRLAGSQNVTIEYNYLASISYFSDHHGEIINMLRESFSSGQLPGNTTIRYNWIDDSGTQNTTGQIIDLTNTGDTDDGVYIYGNVFLNFTGHNGIGSGNSGSPGALTNWKLYNNTFINCLVDFSQISAGSEFRNNLMYGSDMEIFAGSAPATRSNNYYNATANNIGSGTGDVISAESTSVLFRNYSGADYRLGANSQARNIGFTLLPPYNIDAYGLTRVPGAWDTGVAEYSTGIAPPVGLAATVI